MLSSQESLARQNFHNATEKFKQIALSNPASIRERFGAKPISFLKLIDPSMRFPKKLRIIFALLWLEQDGAKKPRRATRFIIKGPRGGGKSKLLGAIGFCKWYLQGRNIVDMGGSLEQAKGVYNYFSGHCYAHDAIIASMPSEPTMQKTQSDRGNYFKAVAASQKQVRGPHPDSLFIDEACETNDDLILSAMPMINTSTTPLIVMTSTFHKIFGYFQETWDDAEKLGWTRYSWDIFDVVAPYDPAIWDDERLNREIPDFADLKARSFEKVKNADGTETEVMRTGDPEGWVPIANVIQAWREKDSIDWFDVEYMGSRPSSTGMVNKPEDVDACVVENLRAYQYRDGAEVIGGLDWGFSSMTSWDELMNHKDGVKVNIGHRDYSQVRSGIIIEDIVRDVFEHKIRKIYADSAGKFENADLQAAINEHGRKTSSEHKCTVVEVKFSVDKQWMIGNYRTYVSRHLLRIPKAFTESIYQHKRYRYMPNSDKVVKKDDHIPDSTQLALKHWPLKAVPNAFPKMGEAARRDAIHSNATSGLMDEVF